MNLPLVDSHTLFIDSTAIESFKTCPTLFMNQYVHKRVRSGPAPARDFGKALHAALELRYRTVGNKPVSIELEEAMLQAATKAYVGIDTPLEEWRTLEQCHNTIRHYNATWGTEQFEIGGVEIPFACDVGTVNGVRVVWQGRIDLLIRLENNWFVMDHKTASAWGKNKVGEYENSGQFKGYAFALQELAKQNPGRGLPDHVVGFALNAIVTRKPGVVSTKLPRCECHRAFVFYSQERLEEWRKDMLEWVRLILDCAARDYMPMNTKHCASFYGGMCPFFDVCTAPPAQRGMVLAGDLFTDNTWSPLTREQEVEV